MKSLLFLALILTPILHAYEEEEEETLTPELTITQHILELKSGPLSYTAVTGFCPILKEGEKEADLFFISYTKEGETDRPLTFVFPGGPGGSGTLGSILTMGPKRLLTAGEGRKTTPPYQIIDNEETLLEYTDLVFVDPVNCGFSRSEEKADLSYFYSVEGDIQTLAEFIHTYIDHSQSWNCPIYLAGGSYGTLRCCGLAQSLFQYGIAVKGVILDGCALDYSTLVSERDHNAPECLLIPTFAATAWYYGRLWPEKPLEEVIDYARRFAYEEYAPAMLQPSRLSYVERLHFEEMLAKLVGLPVETIKRYQCRLNESIYTSEFFSGQRKVLGGLDTRYSGDISTIDPKDAHDPSYLDSLGYEAAFNSYLQTELDTHFPFKKYKSFSWRVNSKWNFGTRDSLGVPHFLQRLRHTLLVHPLMSVFVGSGYYDCRTPFASTEYYFEQLGLPESYKKNLHFAYYEAGHGFFFDYPSLKKWKQDLVKFYTEQAP